MTLFEFLDYAIKGVQKGNQTLECSELYLSICELKLTHLS